MGSVIVDGSREEISGLSTVTWLDTDKFGRTPNRYTNQRTGGGEFSPGQVQRLNLIALHSVHGVGTGKVESCGDTWESAFAYARSFMSPARKASSHFIIAPAGALQLADLVQDRTWTTGAWNPFSIGIEMTEHTDGSQCEAMIKNAVRLVWWLCGRFGIQAQIPVRSHGGIDLGDIPRLQGSGGRNWWGIAFHANKPERGPGDPGPAFGQAFLASGAEGFDLRAGQDLETWRARQLMIGAPTDGIPGPQTVAAIRAKFGRSTWATPKSGGTSNTGFPTLIALLGLAATVRFFAHR